MTTASSTDLDGARPFRVVLASPLLRGATIAMFLSGLGMAAVAPQIAMFLVNELHASLTVAGLYYLTNLTAPIAGYLIGRRSDRTGVRLALFRVCATAGFVGWMLIAFATEVWVPFVVAAIVLGFAGASVSQLFAAVYDELQARKTPGADGVVSLIRMSLTAGWVVGPVFGAFVAAQFGYRAMLIVAACASIAQLIPFGVMREPHRHDPAGASAPSAVAPGLRAMLPLLAFTGLYVLVYAGEPIKYAYLPIYMNQQLHLPALVSGAVIGIQPLVELILMPVAVVVARRVGMMRLMVLGALFGVLANVCFATMPSAVGMFAGQVLMGGVWGVFAGLGVIVAQRLLPQAVATASAVFMSSPAISSALGGLIGGLGVSAVGLPLVFFAPAVCALVAALGLALMSRSTHGIR